MLASPLTLIETSVFDADHAMKKRSKKPLDSALQMLSSHMSPVPLDTRESLADEYSAMADRPGAPEKLREAGMLFAVAEGKLEQEEPDECLKGANDALGIFKSAGDKKGMADTLRLIIDAHRLQSIIAREITPTKALAVAEEEAGKFKEAGDKRGEAVMNLSLAEIYSADAPCSSNLASALESATSALKALQDIDDKKMEANAQVTLSHAQFMMGSSKEAREAAEAALDIFKDLGDMKGQAKALHAIALSYQDGEDWDTCTKKASEALALYKEMGDKNGQAFELKMMSVWFLECEKPKKALPMAKEAYELYKDFLKGKGAGQDAYALMLIVEALSANHQARKAVKVAKDGLTYYQELGDKKAIAFGMMVLLRAYLRADALEDAEKTGEECLDMCKAIGDKRMEMDLLMLMKDIYVKKDDIEGAVQSCADAGNLAQELDDVEEEAWALYSTGGIYLEKQRDDGDLNKAASSASDARSSFQRADIKWGEGAALLDVAIASYNKGDSGRAMASAQDALDLFEEDGCHRGEDEALRMITEFYMAEDKYDKALEQAEKRKQLGEDLENKRIEASAMCQMADVCIKQEELEEAEKWAKLSRETFQKMMPSNVQKRGEVAALLMLTQTYLELLLKEEPGDISNPAPGFAKARDLAVKAANEATKLAGKAMDKLLRAFAVFWRGRVLASAGRGQDSLRCAQDAERIFRDQKDATGEAQSLIMQGYVHDAMKDKDKALEVANRALEIAREAGDNESEANALEAIKKFEAKPMQMQQQMSVQDYQPMAQQGAAQAASVAKPQPKGLDPKIVNKKIMDMVQNVLASDDEISGDSPFMESGMDSLSSVQLVSEVSREFQMSLAPSLVFDFPTVNALTQHLVEESMSIAM